MRPIGLFKVTFLSLVVLLFTTTASAIPRVQARLNGNWSPDQRLVVKAAAHKAITRMFTDSVFDCAKRNARKDHPSRLFWERVAELKSGIDLAVVEVRELSMSCPALGAATTGRAYINQFAKGKNGSGEDYYGFEIQLNQNCIGSGSRRYNASNSNFWAGVIAHEMGHNLGLVHPSGYPGSWITEWDKCVENAGGWSASFESFAGTVEDER